MTLGSLPRVNKLMSRFLFPCFALLLLLSPAAPGAAQDQAPTQDPAQGPAEAPADPDLAAVYSDCMNLARVQPEEAFEKATAWAGLDGGYAARHCAAIALLGLGEYREAADRLEILAEDLSGPDAKLRVGVLAQAGQAWLLGGDTTRAYATQSAALRLEPENVELLIDRAVTLASAANYWEAIDDLNAAQELAPGRGDIFIFRASAYRFVDANELALEDVNHGLRLDPDNPEGLLERGILRRLAGDTAGAREDWLRVVTLAEGSPAAEAAQANLEALDVKAE
ncbi:MAG: tetratricopeptide repeat protein [Kiloniellales bacterium]